MPSLVKIHPKKKERKEQNQCFRDHGLLLGLYLTTTHDETKHNASLVEVEPKFLLITLSFSETVYPLDTENGSSNC